MKTLNRLFATVMGATSIALVASFPTVNVQAAAPMISAQPAAFYTIKVGAFEVTAVYDGGGPLSPTLLHEDAQRVLTMLESNYLPTDNIQGSIAGFVVNTGSKLILIDTGTGGQGTKTGKFMKNFRAAGYQPEQVDEILLTHLHHDHVGGIVGPDGQALFPNAVIRLAQSESDYWLSPSNAQRALDGEKDDFEVARKAAKPYEDSGRWSPFQAGKLIDPGIQALALPGHTPGHTGYQLTSNGHTLFIWGDVVNFAVVQLPRPSISVDFDNNPVQAAKTRAALLRRLSQEGALVAGPHMPFPGFGHLRVQAQGYAWIPVTYSDAIVQP
jgi:glyoxylase-like metal-dependent hydrolase (beta-lactamase superfamily II)